MNTRFVILLLIAGLIAAQQLSSQQRAVHQAEIWARAEVHTFRCNNYGTLEVRLLADSAELRLSQEDQLVFQARLPKIADEPVHRFGTEKIDFQQHGATIQLTVDGERLFENCPITSL